MRYKYKYKREIISAILYIGLILLYYTIYDRNEVNVLSFVKMLVMTVMFVQYFSIPKETYKIEDRYLIIYKKKESISILIDDIKLIESSSISMKISKYNILMEYRISINGKYRTINGKAENNQREYLATTLNNEFDIQTIHVRSGFYRIHNAEEMY